MRKFLVLLIMLLLVTACRGGGTEPAAGDGQSAGGQEPAEEPGVDEETGLPLNPRPIPQDEFVVEGFIYSMSLVPQNNPEFVIESAAGQRYRFRSQPLGEFTYVDGSPIRSSEIRQGMSVRAIVVYAPDSGPTGEYRTDNLLFVKEE